MFKIARTETGGRVTRRSLIPIPIPPSFPFFLLLALFGYLAAVFATHSLSLDIVQEFLVWEVDGRVDAG